MTNPANHVKLTGRVSSAPKERELPSGDLILAFRIVVPRTAKRVGAKRRAKTKQSVDVFDCTAWSVRSRRTAARFGVDDQVTVTGELRRSFRSSGTRTTSFVGIDIDTCSRVT